MPVVKKKVGFTKTELKKIAATEKKISKIE